MQYVSTATGRTVPIWTALVSGLLFFLAGVVIAVSTPAVIAGLSVRHDSNARISVQAVGFQAPDAQERNEQLSQARARTPEDTHGH